MDGKCKVAIDHSWCEVNVFSGLLCSAEIKSLAITCFLITFPLVCHCPCLSSKSISDGLVQGQYRVA